MTRPTATQMTSSPPPATATSGSALFAGVGAGAGDDEVEGFTPTGTVAFEEGRAARRGAEVGTGSEGGANGAARRMGPGSLRRGAVVDVVRRAPQRGQEAFGPVKVAGVGDWQCGQPTLGDMREFSDQGGRMSSRTVGAAFWARRT